jgi:hypothetical protein
MNIIHKIRIILPAGKPHLRVEPDVSPDDRWNNPMTYLIRVAFTALSLATITPVANAAAADTAAAPVQQNSQSDWANG